MFIVVYNQDLSKRSIWDLFRGEPVAEEQLPAQEVLPDDVDPFLALVEVITDESSDEEDHLPEGWLADIINRPFIARAG